MSDAGERPEPDRTGTAPHPRETRRLIGQDAAVAEILAATQCGTLHHAWLLSGPRGIGKATLAWAAAAHLLDPATATTAPTLFAPSPPSNFERAPDDPIRRRLIAGSEPRLFVLRRPFDEKTNRLRQEITVEEVRRMKSYFALSAADGGRRVAIVDAVDELNANAANALLKLLEEPPRDVVILLVCHRPSAILPTIRSRCRTLRCAPLGPEDLSMALEAAGFTPGETAAALATLAGGSVGRAVEFLEHDGLKSYADIVKLCTHLPRFDRAAALALAERCTGRGAEARFRLTIELFDFFLARLARAGVLGPPETQGAPGEARLLTRLAPDPVAARGWATLAQSVGARARRGASVNLDPAALILDMVLSISKEAGRIVPAN